MSEMIWNTYIQNTFLTAPPKSLGLLPSQDLPSHMGFSVPSSPAFSSSMNKSLGRKERQGKGANQGVSFGEKGAGVGTIPSEQFRKGLFRRRNPKGACGHPGAATVELLPLLEPSGLEEGTTFRTGEDF